MDIKINENKLIELFVEIDELLKAYDNYLREKGLLGGLRPTRVPRLNASEVCTVLVAYHYSGYKCFEYYYRQVILGVHADCFPGAPGYEAFLGYVARAAMPLYLWLFHTACTAQRTGLYFIDSKKLEVCHPRRERSHRVFKGIAAKGKSSTGWFYGLKLHLVINNLGEVASFLLTPGNVADNNKGVLRYLLSPLKGTCVGDKGYFTSLFGWFYENGLELVKRPKKNMKALPVRPWKNRLINMRPVIESVFDILGTVCDIDHTRHRKPENALSHILAGLLAYQKLEDKPKVFFPSITNEMGEEKRLLMAA